MAHAGASVVGMSEGYISVRGGKVWYRIEGADRGGTPLLVLHGGPGAPHDYLEPLTALADERPVIFYDQLGCGNSDRPDAKSLWTIERFVDELGWLRDRLGLKKVHILGHSWGTMLAVDYMLTRRPQGIVSLILSGPCLSAPRFIADQRVYLAQMPDVFREVIMACEASDDFHSPQYQEAMIQYYKRHVCRLEPWPECLNRTLEKMGSQVYEYMWGPSEFSAMGTLKDYERAHRLKEIDVPVLFTCGSYDEATPASTLYYQSMLPGSEIVVFKDASHEHHLEKTIAYLATVRGFLARKEKKTGQQFFPAGEPGSVGE